MPRSLNLSFGKENGAEAVDPCSAKSESFLLVDRNTWKEQAVLTFTRSINFY
jgi:hypothetical protein